MDAVVNLVILMAILSVSISLGLIFERTVVRGLFRLVAQRQRVGSPGSLNQSSCCLTLLTTPVIPPVVLASLKFRGGARGTE
jgi:hypothetical protein